jgi:ethanolamine ammonia-lyase large subunit
MKQEWGTHIPDIQIIISDGLNVRALLDEGHLTPYLTRLKDALHQNNYHVGANNIVIRYGRVRAGYACGEFLFSYQGNSNQRKSIIHIIGERPGSGHHNFSAYITVAPTDTWNQKGVVDHDISRVVSGISDTSLPPERAVTDTLHILEQLYTIV